MRIKVTVLETHKVGGIQIKGTILFPEGTRRGDSVTFEDAPDVWLTTEIGDKVVTEAEHIARIREGLDRIIQEIDRPQAIAQQEVVPIEEEQSDIGIT